MRKAQNAKTFNEYVNELISEYHTNEQVDTESLARKHNCTNVPLKHFKLMSLDKVNRRLTLEETEIIFRYVRCPNANPVPFFYSDENKNTTEVPLSDSLFDATTEESDAEIESTEIVANTNSGWLSNIISKTKNAIADLLMRKRANGIYLQWAKTDDGTEVFTWVNRHGDMDYVLRLNGKEVTDCGAIDDDAELRNLNFDKCDKKQAFHVAFYLKHLLHETQRKNKIYKTKLNAIAEILVMEDEEL